MDLPCPPQARSPRVNQQYLLFPTGAFLFPGYFYFFCISDSPLTHPARSIGCSAGLSKPLPDFQSPAQALLLILAPLLSPLCAATEHLSRMFNANGSPIFSSVFPRVCLPRPTCSASLLPAPLSLHTNHYMRPRAPPAIVDC